MELERSAVEKISGRKILPEVLSVHYTLKMYIKQYFKRLSSFAQRLADYELLVKKGSQKTDGD